MTTIKEIYANRVNRAKLGLLLGSATISYFAISSFGFADVNETGANTSKIQPAELLIEGKKLANCLYLKWFYYYLMTVIIFVR